MAGWGLKILTIYDKIIWVLFHRHSPCLLPLTGLWRKFSGHLMEYSTFSYNNTRTFTYASFVRKYFIHPIPTLKIQTQIQMAQKRRSQHNHTGSELLSKKFKHEKRFAKCFWEKGDFWVLRGLQKLDSEHREWCWSWTFEVSEELS